MNRDNLHLFPTHSARLRSAWLVSLLLLSACSISQLQPDGSSQGKPQAEPQAVAQKPTDSITGKKLAFFALMKPLVEQENARIARDRQRLLDLQADKRLKADDRKWLQQLASRYGLTIKERPDGAVWQSLLARVDTVPVDLAVVQAANESAWGTSRFARQANNYFGQWCYEKGCGMVPAERSDGATHEVKRFSSAGESVRAYMLNLNRSKAYAEFRKLRQATRQSGKPADAELLAMGLKAYSERGMDYVNTIRAMIRSNRELIRLS